jgi:hypothetical protein
MTSLAAQEELTCQLLIEMDLAHYRDMLKVEFCWGERAWFGFQKGSTSRTDPPDLRGDSIIFRNYRSTNSFAAGTVIPFPSHQSRSRGTKSFTRLTSLPRTGVR